MDDSERSYGYSEDIYHGRRGPGGHYGQTLRGRGDGPFYPDQEPWERSYEYGPEWSTGQPHPGDYGPEEEAVRTRGRTDERMSWPQDRRHAFGRGGGGGESWTWDVEGPFRGQGPEGYQRTDERIHEEVCERLSAHGRLDAGRVRVRVDDGEVTLEGSVADRRSKRLAEAIADTVRGVADVHNRLTLARGRRRAEGEGGDERLGESAAERAAAGRVAAGRVVHGRGGDEEGGERTRSETPIGQRRPGDRPIAEGRDPETGRLREEGELVGAGAGREERG